MPYYVVKVNDNEYDDDVPYALEEDDITGPVTVSLYNAISGEFIDQEILPILKNGADYEGYHIIPSDYEITYDPDGHVITPTESIYPIITHQKGSNYTKLFENDWETYGLKVTYTIDGSSEENYTDAINPSEVKKQLKFYLYENGKDDWRDYTEVDVTHEHAGIPGPPGESAPSPIIYSAGVFKPGTQYEGTAIKAPYVLYDNKYYIAYGQPDDEENPGDTIIEDPD